MAKSLNKDEDEETHSGVHCLFRKRIKLQDLCIVKKLDGLDHLQTKCRWLDQICLKPVALYVLLTNIEATGTRERHYICLGCKEDAREAYQCHVGIFKKCSRVLLFLLKNAHKC